MASKTPKSIWKRWSRIASQASKHAALFQYYLGQKYAGLKIDLVITVWNPALSYALEHRQELFPNAPILAVVTRPRTFASDANITQVTAGDHFLDTANLALKFHPGTQKIAVVDGSFQKNDDVHAEVARQLGQLPPQVGVEYWRNLELANLVERVKALPRQLCHSLCQTDGENGHAAHHAD